MVVDKRAVGLFYSWDEVANAIVALKAQGLNSKQINLIIKDNERVFLDTNLDINTAILGDDLTTRLVALGIPETKSKLYSDRIEGGSYFVIVDGSDAEIYRSETILRESGIEEFAIYDAFDLNASALKQSLDRESRIANKPSLAESQTKKSLPNEELDATVIHELENLL